MLRWFGNVLLCASILIAAGGIWAYGEHASVVVYVVAGMIVFIGFITRFFLADSGNGNEAFRPYCPPPCRASGSNFVPRMPIRRWMPIRIYGAVATAVNDGRLAVVTVAMLTVPIYDIAFGCHAAPSRVSKVGSMACPRVQT